MENHPIPQDITGFQFKLVGKMTVRQFIYVGVGVFLAWLIYFVLKFPLFLSLPLSLFFLIGGAALAFLPVDGRPMDVMIRNFITSIVAPTQYVYEKQGGSAFTPGQTSVDVKISQTIPQAAVPAQQPPAPSPMPTPVAPTSPIQEPVDQQKIEAQEENAEKEEAELEAEIKTAQSEHHETSQLEEKLNETIRQKELLEKELADLKAKIDNMQAPSAPLPEPAPAIQQSPVTETAIPVTPSIPAPQQESIQPAPLPTPPSFTQSAPQPVASAPTIPAPIAPLSNVLPEEPNVVKGTVKDSRGNPIQNILVEVKDEEDNPVRAFKTNAKGEFASATSLPNGNYTVVLEDPKMVHKFDTHSIMATGGALTPLGIVSIDPREELRRELFN